MSDVQEQQLKDLKRKVLARNNRSEAIIFELQEIHEVLMKKEDKESSLINTVITTQEKAIESFLEPYLKRIEQLVSLNEMNNMNKMIPRVVNNDPTNIQLDLRPIATMGEIIQYEGKLYFCTDSETPIFKKLTLKE